MVELAIAGNSGFQISTVDIDRPGPHYTVDTVTLLREEYGTGADETFFIMGADSLIHLLTWHLPNRLVEICRLTVVARPGYRPDLTEIEAALPGLKNTLQWVEMPVLGIASSDLQHRISQGRSIRYQTPDSVLQYIHDHGFYRDE
jgi:nicotinate-nucleotide adenylyltransferase